MATNHKSKASSHEGNLPKLPPSLIFIGFAAVAVLLVFVIGAFAFMLPQSGGVIPSSKPNGVAVIPLKGEIAAGGDPYDGVLSSSEIADLIDKAENDSGVSVILLDIDSPGGEVVASKQIVYKIRQAKKPVYSYINSLGASGAYYAAAATDYVMADEDSLTGSIGVISIFPNFIELLNKIGVKVTILKEGKFKAAGSGFTDFNEEEQQLFQALLSETYQKFRGDVLEFRKGKISSKTLDQVADGRIISGRQALRYGLVDELLPKTELYTRIGTLEGIENPEPVYYGEQPFSLTDFFLHSGKAFGNGFVSSIKAQESQSIQLK